MTTSPNALRENARNAIASQPFKTITVLSSLLSVQDALGWLPSEALEEVSIAASSTINEVWGVASFYPNFRFTEPPKNSIEVCWGPTCHVLGAQDLLQSMLNELGLENEGETQDKLLGLKLNTCLGVCPHGPAVSFNHRLEGKMTKEKALAITKSLVKDSQDV